MHSYGDAGATFGMYTALTGVKLSGQTTAVAEGNALGKGALVYHLFPSALQIIQDRAAGRLIGWQSQQDQGIMYVRQAPAATASGRTLSSTQR